MHYFPANFSHLLLIAHSFDLDLPLECDDEYWDNGFQQPADKPSSISFFNTYIRLVDILAYAMRLIVCWVVKHCNFLSLMNRFTASIPSSALEITSDGHLFRSNKS